MSRRITSLSNSAVGIERDIGSEYDNIKIVADNLDAILAASAYELPVGGTTGQVLSKISNTDRSVGWSTPATTLDEVTANGNTTANDVSVGKVTTTSVQLSGGTGTQGTLSWNADEETLDLVNNGATLQLGQELHIHCRNNTGVPILDGVAVMYVGTIGASGRILIAPLVSDGSVPATDFLGITTEVIGNGEDGKVTAFGKIRGLDTSEWADSTALYSDPTIPGGFTSTLPSAPNLKMPIAHVIYSHATNGTVNVLYGVGANLHSNDKVEVLSPDADGNPQVDHSSLMWNNTAKRWENHTPAETKTALGYLTDAPSDGTPYARQDGGWVAGGGGGGSGDTVVSSGNFTGVTSTLTLDWDALRAEPGSLYELTIATGSRSDSIGGVMNFRTSLSSSGTTEKLVMPANTVTYTNYSSASYTNRALCNLPGWNWMNRGLVKMIFTLDRTPAFSGRGLIIVEHVQQLESDDSLERVKGIFSHNIGSSSSSTVQFNLVNKDFAETSYRLTRRQE